MSSAAVRRVVSPVRTLCRYASTSESKPPQKSFFLTPEKKRALISLYHQSDTFITPENLSERIDQAFLKSNRESTTALSLLRTHVNKGDLEGLVREQETAPKFAEWNREVKASSNSQWSGGATPREWRIIEALYGVDVSDSKNVMPGLEALEEYMETDEGKVLLEEQQKVERVKEDEKRQAKLS